MKRFHVHLNVNDLDRNVEFYSALFAARPTVVKPDYAKWMLDEPRVNFAISTTGRDGGLDHLGFQVDTAEELATLGPQLTAAGGALVPEAGAICCYARSDKLWTEDPQGTRWETFHTIGEATTYYAADAACATDGTACTPNPRAMKPMIESGGTCCAPKSGCC